MPEQGIGYRIRSLELVDLFIGPRPPEFNGNEFHFDIRAESRISHEKKILFAVTTIIVRDLNKTEPVGKVVTVVGFDVENFDQIIIPTAEDENKFIVPDELEMHTRMISISTTRGIMFSHFKGTHLHKAILPVIPQLMQQNAEDVKRQKGIKKKLK